MTACSIHPTAAGYKVAYRHEGRQRSRSFIDRPSAARWASVVRSAGIDAAMRVLTEQAPDRIVTLSEALEEHLAQLIVKPGTLLEYKRLAERTWVQVLGPMPVHALTKRDIVAWVEAERKRLAPKTIANAHGLLSAVMTTAVDQGHATGNPCRGVRMPTGEKDEKPWLTEAELARLIRAMDDWHRPFVVLLGTTGLRFGEATALQWRDVDLASSRLKVARTWHKVEHGWEMGAPKTRKSKRTIALAPVTVEALQAVRDRSDGKPADLVFVGAHGGARIWPSRFLTHSLRPALKRAGITANITPHSLRDSHASHLVGRGVPLPVVQARLGHESITTTVDKYVHLSPDIIAQAVDATQLAIGGTSVP